MNVGHFATFALLAFIIGGIIYSATHRPDASNVL
jgi:hypothetical protein